MHSEERQYLCYVVERRRFALPVGWVDRVIPAVAVTPLPNSPPALLGVIDVHGRVTPVLNYRKMLHLPEREVRPDDRMILLDVSGIHLALVADQVHAVVTLSPDHVARADEIFSGRGRFSGIVPGDDDLIFVHEGSHFLLPNETKLLDGVDANMA